LYGTETSLKVMITGLHQAGLSEYVDLVLGHNGYATSNTVDSNGVRFGPTLPPNYSNTVPNGGGYPGMVTTLPNAVDGDFFGVYAQNGYNVAGLIAVDHTTNNLFIRNPVDSTNPLNIPAGNTPSFGRLANVPDPNNARFYPDKSQAPIYVYDPKTGEQNLAIYPFNNQNPLNGTPVAENVTGYLMRNTQWLVQSIGVDGFRLDAEKNMAGFVLNYFDRAVYRSSTRRLLDGSQPQVFSFGEVYDGNQAYLQTFVRKDINPANPGTIGGNRDVLDFPLFFALRDNLTSNGYQNDWGNIRHATFDLNDDGYMNGSQGVHFVQSHDNTGPALSNVAYAYTLMIPGNAIVYYNAHEFGSAAQRNFPQDGRGDALGGMYGNTLTKLVNIRDVYAQGNYIERWSEKENFAFERQHQSLTLLSNRLDSGFDSRTLQMDLPVGTYLVELTGNAHAWNVAHPGDIPEVVQVNSGGTVNVRFLRNQFPDGSVDHGYLVYGLQSPQGGLTLTNVSRTISGSIPTSTGNAQTDGYNNATTLVSDIQVITGNALKVQLNTLQVNLLGSIRDHNADGDNALIKLDQGQWLGGGTLYTDPNNTVAYGFTEFGTTNGNSRAPGYFSTDGNGLYVQNIDTSGLTDGLHYLTVRAFRHRDDGGPAVYTDFKETLYVDRNKPVSAVDSFTPIVTGVNENQRVQIRSVDLTADNIHVFLDLPANLTDDQIRALVGSGSQGTQIDRDLWTKDFNGLSNGNHVLTVVTFRMTGTNSVTRIPGYYTSTLTGLGLGDVNFDGQVNQSDIGTINQAGSLAALVASNNSQFNPAADLNGDGKIDLADIFLMGPRLTALNASPLTQVALTNLTKSSMVTTGTYTVQGVNGASASHTIYDDTAASTIVTAGCALIANTIHGTTGGSSLTINVGATVTLHAGGGTSKLTTLSVDGGPTAPTGTLDVTNNALILVGGDLENVRNLLHAGYHAGTWTGTGLTSSTAAANAGHALAYFTGAQYTALHSVTALAGQSFGSSDVVVQYALIGDTTLKGYINAADFAQLDASWLKGIYTTSGAHWINGDFNYDGIINSTDFALLDAAYSAQSGGLAYDPFLTGNAGLLGLTFSDYAALVAAQTPLTGNSTVPEPATLLLLTGGLSLLATRRRGSVTTGS
ncbi:MAG: dockerin type I domain-containing protein, partial [Phycisphaerae bacterium]